MLEISGISKKYGQTTVLEDISFSLEPGKILGIAGHNGSGKSTLLSIVAQVLKADSGTITYNGVPVLGNRSFMRHNLGFIPQRNSLLPDLSVQETLQFWQRTYGRQAPLFAADSPATLLGLTEIAKKKVGALSGGMQKRLSTALALLHNPQVLLMDEVLGALDRQYRLALLAWMRQLLASGGSIMYCSHEIADLQQVCDNILVLRGGKMVFFDSAANFPTTPERLDVIMNPPLPGADGTGAALGSTTSSRNSYD